MIDAAILAFNVRDVAWPLHRLRGQGSTQRMASERILILPCDPQDPVGSMGDMAMLSGLAQSLRKSRPATRFTLVGVRSGTLTVPGVGAVELSPAWAGREGTIAFDGLLREHDALYALGADVLDGNYGPRLVCRFTEYCNHAARLGIPATIVGFSFNSRPRRPAVYALSRLDPAVQVNVRGKTSLERFATAIGVRPQLCADVAFLMDPSATADDEIENWIGAARAAGRIPVGLNINSHAFAAVISRIGLDALITGIAAQLARVSEQERLSFLLLPHDNRPIAGDTTLLPALERALRAAGCAHVLYAPVEDPARIKRLAGKLDLVVTARMHLAIAALGMGTPVLTIVYQDKFEDLREHFALPAEVLIEPAQCLEDDFSIRIARAVARVGSARAQIARALPGVLELARRNVVAWP